MFTNCTWQSNPKTFTDTGLYSTSVCFVLILTSDLSQTYSEICNTASCHISPCWGILCHAISIDTSSCIWSASWQNQQYGCAPSGDSDQPWHPPSLIRVFAVRMKKTWVLSEPLSAQRRLWSEWAHAQADLSHLWAHTYFAGFVTRWLISGSVCNLLKLKSLPSKRYLIEKPLS